MSDSSCQIQL
ncbi:hypothetical protein A2U01_0066168, partial [Trifolium medium]|nr:hypothetical protein [Trifolium medium]